MKNAAILTFFLFIANLACSQTPSVSWSDVQVFQFEAEGVFPDSLEICGGEWFLKTSARSMSELSAKDLKKIKKQMAKLGCDIVFIDGKQFYDIPEAMYYLGLKRKEK